MLSSDVHLEALAVAGNRVISRFRYLDLGPRLTVGSVRVRQAAEVVNMADLRGPVWEHDPGPAKTSGWPELFAATPNYRGLGLAVLHR